MDPIAKAVDDAEGGLAGYRFRPGDSLVRVVLAHRAGHRSPERSAMRLSDLLRPDTVRAPEFMPVDSMLRHVARVAQRQAAFASHGRPLARPDEHRLSTLLHNVELTADATTAADAVIADDAKRRAARTREQHARWEQAVYQPISRALCDAIHGQPGVPPGTFNSGEAKSQFKGSLVSSGRSGGLKAAPHPRRSAESHLRQSLQQVVSEGERTAGRFWGSSAPGKAAELLSATNSDPPPPFRPMLPPTSWSALAVSGSDIGHIGSAAWVSGAGVHEPGANTTTLHLDASPAPGEASAAWASEAPRSRRHVAAAAAGPVVVGGEGPPSPPRQPRKPAAGPPPEHAAGGSVRRPRA